MAALKASLLVLVPLAILGVGGYWDAKLFLLVSLAMLGVVAVLFAAMILVGWILGACGLRCARLTAEEFEEWADANPSLPCHQCGYDLRATRDRCPECGAVPEPPHNPPL